MAMTEDLKKQIEALKKESDQEAIEAMAMIQDSWIRILEKMNEKETRKTRKN